ncbi:glycosyltransferase family 4 protein [Saccharicrinis sp. 156]|uniref:glycosyltransferase family 4 protein n=1 Tax=Saccharicrinis sp. 156 TaxID=3417574 RepID=UPI003D358810
MSKSVHITFFQRRPYDFHFSIEKLFETIRENFSEATSYYIFTLPYYSQGLIPRIKSAFAARKKQGTINHITGDIHFITPFLKKNRTINTYHDFTFLKNSKGFSRFILWLFWVYIPVKRSRYITVISGITQKELIKYTGCREEKIMVIPNIISQDFKVVPKTFSTKCPVILHIGSTPNKNIERLVDAIQEIECKLVIVGKLAESHQVLLKEKSINFENHYQISEEELKQAYINCDLLSFCSLNEGFGLPILEAQATGRPVVTSNLSSMPEVAGDAACLVDPYNIESIKEGILKVINDEVYRNTLIHLGLENVKRFNPQTVAGMYEGLYQKIWNKLNQTN